MIVSYKTPACRASSVNTHYNGKVVTTRRWNSTGHMHHLKHLVPRSLWCKPANNPDGIRTKERNQL